MTNHKVFNLQVGLKELEKLPRKEYFAKNQELAKDLWQHENLPTVGDIAQLVNGVETDKMKAIFDFFENRNSFMAMVQKQGADYTEDESKTFIQSVMSSNNTDISKSGYFYKMLMASADDFIIRGENCGSAGEEFAVEKVNAELYQQRIKGQWVEEFGEWAEDSWEEFNDKMLQLDDVNTIHVRMPLLCNSFPHDGAEAKMNGNNTRCICKRCAGILPEGIINIGDFTALMVTEHATQSALNSMNKGVKKDVNDALVQGYDGEMKWDSIAEWINQIVFDLASDKVSARFYQIALMSRIRFDNGLPFVASMLSSISQSGNLFGSYIFNSSDKNFQRMLDAHEFMDDSLKLQIAMNSHEKR